METLRKQQKSTVTETRLSASNNCIILILVFVAGSLFPGLCLSLGPLPADLQIANVDTLAIQMKRRWRAATIPPNPIDADSLLIAARITVLFIYYAAVLMGCNYRSVCPSVCLSRAAS